MDCSPLKYSECPLFTNQQLLRLLKEMTLDVKDFTYGQNVLDRDEIIEAMINDLNSLVRALRRGQRDSNKVYNIFAHAKSVQCKLKEHDK